MSASDLMSRRGLNYREYGDQNGVVRRRGIVTSCHFRGRGGIHRDRPHARFPNSANSATPTIGPGRMTASRRNALRFSRFARRGTKRPSAGSYRACKDAVSDEYDFAAVYHCYRGRSSAIVADRAAAAEIAAKKELATLFPTLPASFNVPSRMAGRSRSAGTTNIRAL